MEVVEKRESRHRYFPCKTVSGGSHDTLVKVNALRERTPTVPACEAGRDTAPYRGRQEGV
jgi:hypothetical protein